ncbi:hypothetical protein Q5O14_14130 [Eubacteriaceae bacterium ES2]|nr:hypothetical protein Q5O14_14130 [Eubacteriaceae bacterium ES2]
MSEIRNNKIKEIEKVFAGLPYLYRTKGLPSEVYEVRFKNNIDKDILILAISDTIERLPYFSVRYEEKEGDFFSVRNVLPLEAHNTDEFIPLGGKANNYHMMGVNFKDNILKISFHHGLTDGRGAKTFLETLVNYYADYDIEADKENDIAIKSRLCKITEMHRLKKDELSAAEYFDPCQKKYELDGKSKKIEGLVSKGFKLPETANKANHRRYELRFSQEEFMKACKKYGASPITILSIMMSRGIQKAYPENKKAIVSNFPMDARHILGCDESFKNCVKSMSLPYGDAESNMSMEALASHYKYLLNAQKDHDYCAKEFNNIVMLLNVIGLFHSFSSRQKLLGFMENLALDTYLISYLGQFDVPEKYIDSVHLYSNCSSGLVLNMTCQSNEFMIDLTQDFESDIYIKALRSEFEAENIDVEVSEEIYFETPYDELKEIIATSVYPSEKINKLIEKIAGTAKKSSQDAKERAIASQNISRALLVAYYDLETGELVMQNPKKYSEDEIEKIVRNMPSVFMK